MAAYDDVLRGDRTRSHRACRGHRSTERRRTRRITPRRRAPRMRDNSVLGWPPNLVFALQMFAIFTCCVPMSMPQAHLVAFCSDLGISPAHGAAMVSVLLGIGILQSSAMGRAVRSHRRPLHHAGRLGVPGGQPVGVHVHPGRSSDCLRFRRCSASASAALFPPMSWPRASCSRSAKPIGVFRRCCLCSGYGHGGGRLDRRNSL